MFKYEIASTATGEPVQSTDVEEHLRVTISDDDALISRYIVVARQRVEAFTNRQLMPVTSYVYLDAFPSGPRIDLPWAPLRAIASTGVEFTDSSGNTTNMASSDFEADTKAEPGALSLTFNGEWPEDTLDRVNPIRIEMTNGYATEAAVPEIFKLGISMYVADMYEQRENFVAGTIISPIPDTVKNILSQERLWTF